jgi:hypothetical protein
MNDDLPSEVTIRAQQMYFRACGSFGAQLPSGATADLLWSAVMPQVQARYTALARARLNREYSERREGHV